MGEEYLSATAHNEISNATSLFHRTRQFSEVSSCYWMAAEVVSRRKNFVSNGAKICFCVGSASGSSRTFNSCVVSGR